MNKIVALTASFVFLSHLCTAQLPTLQPQEVEVPGQIVYDNTTADVTFIALKVRSGFSIENLESKVWYIDKNGVRKKIRPKDCQEIRFKWDEQEERMISRRPVGNGRRKRFLRLMVDGRARFYEYI